MTLTNDDLQALANLIDTSLDVKLDQKLQPVHNRLDKIENRLDKVEGRLDKVESEVSSLNSGQLELKKGSREILKKVSETYELALEAWGKSTENRVWLDGKKLKL